MALGISTPILKESNLDYSYTALGVIYIKKRDYFYEMLFLLLHELRHLYQLAYANCNNDALSILISYEANNYERLEYQRLYMEYDAYRYAYIEINKITAYELSAKVKEVILMNVNDIVYTLDGKIGIIDRIINDKYYIKLSNNEEELLPITEINPVSKEMLSYFLTDDFLDEFSLKTLEKGLDYFRRGKVISKFLIDKVATGRVDGNSYYQVTLNLKNNRIKSSCTCPVGISCKHAAALCYSLQNDFITIKKKNPLASANIGETKQVIKNDENKSNVRYLLERCVNDFSYQRLIDFSIALNSSDLSKDELYELMKYLKVDKFQSYYYVRAFMQIVYSKKYHTLACEIIDEYSFPSLIKNLAISPLFEEYEKGTLESSIYNRDRMYVYTANLDYAKLLGYGLMYEMTDLIKIALANTAQTIDLIDDIILDARKVRTPRVLKTLFENLNDDDVKLYMLKVLKRHFLTGTEYITCKPGDNVYYALSHVITDDLANYVIINFDTLRAQDEKALYALASDIALATNKKRISNSILKSLKFRNEAKYIYEFLSVQLDPSYDFMGDYQAFNEYQFKYLDYEYFINLSDKCISEEIVLRIGENYFTTITIEDDVISYSNSYLYNSDKFFKDVVKYVFNSPEMKDKINAERSKFQAIINERKKAEFIRAIDIFSNEINNEKLNVINDFKVHLEYSIYMDMDECSLELKIGSPKKTYIVKDIIKLVDDIKNAREYKYGKELDFVHLITNFTDEDIPAIKYLLSCPITRGYDKSVHISSADASNLLKLLKGRTVKLAFEDYKLTLNEKAIEVLIDSDYNLKFKDNVKLFVLDDVFVLNDDGTADIAIVDPDALKLIKFVNENKNMNLALVKNEFTEKIYSRYPTLINIAPEIKDEFKLSTIRIDAYFDYVDKAVTLETHIFKDDVELTSTTFMTQSDKFAFSLYANYIESLGFEDGKHLTEEAKILSFFYLDFTYLKSIANVYLSDTIKSKSVIRMTSPTITVKYENSMMQVFLEDSDYDKDELAEIMKAIHKKKSFALLKDNRIIDLSTSDASDFYDTVNDLRLDINNLDKKIAIPVYDAIKAYAHKENVVVDDYVENMIKDITTFKANKSELPILNAKLREYQKDAFKWLKVLSDYNMGGILADDMGLGKTLEFISLIESDRKEMPSIIVCPKALLFNWCSEFEKFTSNPNIKMIFGGATERHKLIKAIDNNKRFIYVTAYDSLRNDIDEYKNKKFNYLIIDEAQAIKNVNAQKTQMVKELNAIHRFALTGTPIENNVFDLWSIFDFIMPGYLGELSEFKAKYQHDKNYTDIIAKKIAPFILRRTKKEVLKDLPAKYERILSCEMTKEQRKIYDAHVEDAKKKIDLGAKSFDLLPYLTRLRQICVEPKTFIPGYSNSSGKLEELRELIPEYIENGHRMLLFSSFVEGLKCVGNLLDELNIKYYMLTGDTKADERLELCNSFNDSEEIKIFLISLKAGGTGLNLTGADTVIHLDPWWNLSAENQASDRAHRIGQKRNVEVIKLVSLNSIEQKVIELQNLKKDIIDKLISNDDKSITSFSFEDIKFILE